MRRRRTNRRWSCCRSTSTSARSGSCSIPRSSTRAARTTIDFYAPSYDGKHVALSLSKSGSEVGTAYVLDVATGKQLPDAVPRVMYPTAGGSIEWSADSQGFYYTRYPAPGERSEADQSFYQTVWFHRLGTPVDFGPVRDRA